MKKHLITLIVAASAVLHAQAADLATHSRQVKARIPDSTGD
jgi:hypothetical protein